LRSALELSDTYVSLSVEKQCERHYSCSIEDLSASLQDKFVGLGIDEGTRHFLATTPERGCLGSFFHGFLSMFLSNTDALGYLGYGQMHVLSSAQFQQLVTASNTTKNFVAVLPKWHRLLDVGAGCGTVTEQLAPYFDEVITTEASTAMAYRLRRRGFRCIKTTDLSSAELQGLHFDMISCFNVLDRCSEPLALLQHIRRLLLDRNSAQNRYDNKSHNLVGRLILSVVLPFKPFVELGPLQGSPIQRLPLDAMSWEESVNQLVYRVLSPAGFRVDCLSRVPYISAGDTTCSFYLLSNAVLVLTPVEESFNSN